MNEKTKKARIIVAFGDISGFSDFCDAITNDEVEYDPLMDAFDSIVAAAEKETGFHFTDTGDGFMCTVDLEEGDPAKIIIGVLIALNKVLRQIEGAITDHRKNSVGPDGFRIVVTAGWVKRKVRKDGRITIRGKVINQAHNYLDTARGYGLVVHDSARNLISDGLARKNGIEFARFKKERMLSVVKIVGDRRKK